MESIAVGFSQPMKKLVVEMGFSPQMTCFITQMIQKKKSGLLFSVLIMYHTIVLFTDC